MRYTLTMSLLSAIFSGRKGFLDASTRMSQRADRLAKSFHEDLDAEVNRKPGLAEDLVGMQMDRVGAQANAKTFSLSAELFQEIAGIGKK